MRDPVDASRVDALMRGIGRYASGPGAVYLTGGASAILEGWRLGTIDVDLKLDPEPAGVFQAIADLKTELRINIELAAPDHFLPTLESWRAHSKFIVTYGMVDFYHYDFRAQALAKLARGRDRDLRDSREMIGRGLISRESLRSAFEEIRPRLIRFPGLNAEAMESRLKDLIEKKDE